MVPIDDATIDKDKDATRELDALGTWSDDPTYGEVWTPNDESYVPYETDGQWVSLDDETTFVSDVTWALPTYSNGRWFSDTTPKGPRWRWAAHGKPTTIVPVDVVTLSPNVLRVLDLTNVAARARAQENVARMNEPAFLAMHGSPHPADVAHETHHFGSTHVVGSQHFASHTSSFGHAHSRGHR